MGVKSKNDPTPSNAQERKIAHGCDLTVVTCMDWRGSNQSYAKLVQHLSERFKVPNIRFDHLSVPGACLYLARGPALRREALLEDIGTAIALHHVETVVLVPHQSCGGYRRAMTFKDGQHELKTLITDVFESERQLKFKFGEKLKVFGSIALMDEHDITGFHPVTVPGVQPGLADQR